MDNIPHISPLSDALFFFIARRQVEREKTEQNNECMHNAEV